MANANLTKIAHEGRMNARRLYSVCIALTLVTMIVAGPGHAGHRQWEPAGKPGAQAVAQVGTAAPAATQTRRRSEGPSENARFLSRPKCETGCLPGGYLLDFGTGDATGPPGSLPSAPPPDVVTASLPASAVSLTLGMGALALFSRRKSRAPP
jgi:hypothetical protein